MPSSAFFSFKAWFHDNGGQFHPQVQFVQVPSGFSVVAGDALPTDTTIVRCPFNLAITSAGARDSLSQLLNAASLIDWSERQLISTYLAMHAIIPEDALPGALNHLAYVKTLPTIDKLRTGLHFTPLELEMFKGTNMYGAIVDREREWRLEWSHCRDVVATSNADWGRELTWENYLTAATHLSSRAFPSTLLSPTPSLLSDPTTKPVLLPGVDSLNHARGQPVSWAIDVSAEEPLISLVIHTPISAGQELFNNYGPKPNSELILGYGFSLPENPDDTIVLKVGGSEKKWEIGRDARGMEGLWTEILTLVASQVDSEADGEYEDHLEAAAVLMEMTQTLLGRLPSTEGDISRVEMRPEVVLMFHDYVDGQRDILESVLDFANEKQRIAIEMAKEQGVDLLLEDDE